ncbi:MAG TPA: SDR family NAD(P)-dependent oxidoreductase [Solirubrobacteraceae bacterium]|nr:SDR family NAD(P)-dependent oxidoreductase [Solirubrobacteraceae bacterium]
MSLIQKTVLVTGAGRGIGKAIALLLAERGARVVVNDLHPDRARSVYEELHAAGGKGLALAFDVVDYEAVQDGITSIARALGPVDVLVNNAGIPEGRVTGPFRDSSPYDWKAFVDLNVYGAMNCVRLTLPGMCERGWGRVIQISSAAAARALAAHGGESVYAATKSAMEALLRHVSVEVARQGVTCNCVAPGVMDAALAYADRAVVDGVVERVPIGRLGESGEVAEAVAWLASDAAAFVTGQVIHVNGGAYQGR